MNTYMIGGICAFAGLMAGMNWVGQPIVRTETKIETKTETKEVAKYFSSDDRWYAGDADKILDGAARVRTFTSKKGRFLTIRCFRHSPSAAPVFDARYEINAPLLKRVAPDLQKATNIVVAFALDDAPAVLVKAQTGFQHDSLWFLFDMERDVIGKLASAKKISAVPRQGTERIDTVVEFGTVELAKHIAPVIKACELQSTVPTVGATPTPTGPKQ